VAAAVDPALVARRVLREQYDRLHRMLLEVVRQDDVCRRLMTMPGVGPVVALNYRVAIDIPNRFARSRTVGAHIGLTPTRYQSGEIDWTGRISKFGDPMARASLYEAAHGRRCDRGRCESRSDVAGRGPSSPSPGRWASSCIECGSTRRISAGRPNRHEMKRSAFTKRGAVSREGRWGRQRRVIQ
jgi:Transposase IS116/IS110/IS902 family